MEKQLMLGNEALARGLYEAGCRLISSYPGTPSTEITEYASMHKEIYCEWTPNEKVALEVAFGASLKGARSACAMKHVGLNVAADALFTLSYTGINGGLVIFVGDDPGIHSSQNEQDSRHYAISAKIPMLEPSDSEECKDMTKIAFEISELFDSPVMIRTCTRISHSRSIVNIDKRINKDLQEYSKNPSKYVMTPANAIKRHKFVESRMKRITEYSESCPLNQACLSSDKLGIICSGTCYQYVREVFGDSVSILKLGMINPLPEKTIRDFAKYVKRLVVVEELDPIIEKHCRTLGLCVEGKNLFSLEGELSQNVIRKAFGINVLNEKEPIGLQRSPILCSGCPHRGILFALSRRHLIVMGDIGCYTLGTAKPLNMLDSVLCMGASISMAHGFEKIDIVNEQRKKTFSVIGDSTFLHSGISALMNASYNNSNIVVVIMDNSTTGMTGQQPHPGTGHNIYHNPSKKVNLEQICFGMGVDFVRIVNPYDLEDIDKAITDALEVEGPCVIISRSPCTILSDFKRNPPLRIDETKCMRCQEHMKLGCPALHTFNGMPKIDPISCVGCGLCEQICPNKAIKGVK